MKPWKTILALLLVCSVAPAAEAQMAAADPAIDERDRLSAFVHAAILSPEPYVLDLGAAVLDQAADFPEEWDGDVAFGQRVLARVGSGLASDVIGHSAAAVLHHRIQYETCACSGGLRRIGYALSRGFVTRHENGRQVANTSLFIAKFGAAGVSNAWYPKSYTAADAVRDGGLGVGVSALLNVAREFAPELKRLVGIR